MCVESRIQKAEHTLASCDPLLVDSIDLPDISTVQAETGVRAYNGGKDWSSHARASAQGEVACIVSGPIITIGGDLKSHRQLENEMWLGRPTSGMPRPMRLYTPPVEPASAVTFGSAYTSEVTSARPL